MTIIKTKFEAYFCFMSYGAPSWVYERDISLLKTSHESEVSSLNYRIKELEKENSDLKKELAKLENVLFVAIDLLTKKL
jgi:hypothetical protein